MPDLRRRGLLSRPTQCRSTQIETTEPSTIAMACRSFNDGLSGDPGQYTPALRCLYPSGREIRELHLHLSPDEEAVKLLGRNSRRPRSTERVEDEIPLPGGGHDGAAHEAQRLLGGMVTVALLPPWHGGDAPDRGDLGCRVDAVYEVVVEGISGTFALARPQNGLVCVGPRKLGQRLAWRSMRWSDQAARWSWA